MFRVCTVSNRLKTTLTQRFYSSAWDEVRIPVPWGHVAGKWWGPQDKRPILAIHGWQDNSGTFDTLIPLLPKATSVLAIDTPGCGYSSKLPPGAFYHPIDIVILIRRIVKYFKWQKVSLLGHALGATNNYVYTMLYPNDIEFLVCLEGLAPLTQCSKSVEQIRNNIDNFLKYDALNSMNQEPPSFSLQQLEQQFHETIQSVALDKCKHILTRNVKPSSQDPNKYYVSVDPRVNVLELVGWSEEELLKNANRITAPTLLLKTMNSFFIEEEFTTKLIEEITNNNTNFKMFDIDGTHHVHLNNPKCIAGIINEFLNKFDVSDISQSGLRKEN